MSKNEYSVPELVMLPRAAYEMIVVKLDGLSEQIGKLGNGKTEDYLTAAEFMEKTKMCRSTFDELRARNVIKTIKKGRKIYVPASQVTEYFES